MCWPAQRTGIDSHIMRPKTLTLISLAVAGMLCGCVGWHPEKRTHATSVMQFLYPKNSDHIDRPGVPVLRLPLRVGIAFVPASSPNQLGLSEAKKAEMLNTVKASFEGLPYVRSIQIIPTAYLRPEGGFSNLDQLREMFDVDVIALVAYDQVQFTNEGLLSLSYWTIVGAYVIQGEKNDTQTLMETAVYDIASRKLLFRAPGTSQVKASATLANESEGLRIDSVKGFDDATSNMIGNLKSELEDFKTRVKQSPGEFQIEHQAGYKGGGALDALFALLGLGGAGLAAIKRRR